MDEARALAASFIKSDVFNDLLVNGIAPDGTFDWPHTGIVRALRETAEALSDGGWARLDEAERWVVAHHDEFIHSRHPGTLSPARLPGVYCPNVRNQFKGQVKEIFRGDVLSEVDVQTPWGIVSVITTRSVDELQLKAGSDVVALVNSTEASIAKLLVHTQPKTHDSTAFSERALPCNRQGIRQQRRSRRHR